MISTGRLGSYYWTEVPATTLDVRDVVLGLADHLRGLVAGNVSWDSGILQELSAVPYGWRVQDGRVVSPPLDDALLASWPQSTCASGRYDEWYFWEDAVPAVTLRAFCNWMSTSLSEVEALAFPGGFDLSAQLELARPKVVVGEGKGLFVLATSEAPALKLGDLWRAAEQGDAG
jgi:hypothetical protein